MVDSYRNAFTEVYEIIKYLDNYEYNKIPKDIVKVIEQNRNQEYVFFIDESIPFAEQKLMLETKAILFNFFRDFWATQAQKEKIFNFQRKERTKIEEQKKKMYNYEDTIFKKNRETMKK